jgi:multidrug efflux pump subunit AcrA (membrane-fusion protein)
MRFGMTASVALRIDDEASALVLPVAALVDGDGSPAVFVVDAAKQTVRKMPVTVGGAAESGVRIASGLRAGDVIVIAGVQFLRDGMAVRLPGDRPQARTGNPT